MIDWSKLHQTLIAPSSRENDETVQPSGIPGGGDTPSPHMLAPAGFDGKTEHNIFQIFDLGIIAPGAEKTFQTSHYSERWYVQLDGTANQLALVYLGPEAAGRGFPLGTNGKLKASTNGIYITVLNAGAVNLSGIVVALANKDVDYTPGSAGAGGGGGGPATIADGANVVEGSLADAAIITDANGTISGKLRGLVKWAFERMPTSLGQKLMAASFPVTIASDQSAFPTNAAIANGADVTEGALADAAVITDANGTISGKLRGLVKWAFERMPASLGQKTMANSFPATIASDQSAIPELVWGQHIIRDTAGATLAITYADINATADGDNTVVAANATKKTRVLGYVLTTTGAGTFVWKSGGTAIGHIRSGADGGGAAAMGRADAPALENVNVNEALIINNPTGLDSFGHIAYIQF